MAAAAPAPIDGRIDPAPYRAQIEATEAMLYGGAQGDERWKNLSKALLELHNAIVFRDSSPLARETSRRLFFFSAQVDAATPGPHVDEQLAGDARGLGADPRRAVRLARTGFTPGPTDRLD